MKPNATCAARSFALRFTRSEMAAFLDGARRGEFDHLVS
jgi:hypothetical protein